MTLVKFEKKLRTLVPEHDIRPFVCEGSPLACEVFIVGLNPATEGEFWKYWSARQGFDKASWFADYKQARQAQGKRPVSPTRRIIDRVVAAAGVSCLETNIYSVPTSSIFELDDKGRSTHVFEFLLRSIRPKILVLHGKDVSLELLRLFTQTQAKDGVRTLSASWGQVFCVAVKHFSRGWSFDKADQLGQNVRQLLDSSTRP